MQEAMNLYGRQKTYRRAGIHEVAMSNESKLRKWAAEAARQAKVEKDANEARRLSGFAQYWTRLADAEDRPRDDKVA
jgi:hypothetical protein